MGFRLIFQLVDQIACDGMRPAVQANVLNDRAQACLVRVQEVVANTPFQLPRQGAHGEALSWPWALLCGRSKPSILHRNCLGLSISKAPSPDRHGLRLTIW